MAFLEEDLGLGDVTTEALIPEGLKTHARIIVKEDGIIAGLEEAKILFELLGLDAKCLRKDGDRVEAGTVVMEIFGEGRSILMAERTALNILMRMSGIATATRRIVDEIKAHGYRTKVAATRKTAPGLRYFDKRAIVLGGGDPHRLHLDDALLIKDNHLALSGGLREAIRKAKEVKSFTKIVEVEVSSVAEAIEAAEAGTDAILLDNMAPLDVRKVVKALEERGLRLKVLLEASGRITPENVLEYAKEGVDIVSLGSLTHSVKALDLSLKVESIEKRKECLH
ncbi:carboxylating nicotinate-nucleotide diphosphorylase [Candidatus Bathyarchaeota archaeon]|nr:carboxylating nicotinate-nucleotide diphosphorylase [Candidatus Bathyarchaeota archaeon]